VHKNIVSRVRCNEIITITLVVTGFSVLIACSQPRKQMAANNDNEPRVKKLLSSTDRIVIKNFYDPAAVIGPLTREYPSPGLCSFGPVIVYEPGKESERLKGVSIAEYTPR